MVLGADAGAERGGCRGREGRMVLGADVSRRKTMTFVADLLATVACCSLLLTAARYCSLLLCAAAHHCCLLLLSLLSTATNDGMCGYAWTEML